MMVVKVPSFSNGPFSGGKKLFIFAGVSLEKSAQPRNPIAGLMCQETCDDPRLVGAATWRMGSQDGRK